MDIFRQYFLQNIGSSQTHQNNKKNTKISINVLKYKINSIVGFFVNMESDTRKNAIENFRNEQVVNNSTDLIQNNINNLHDQTDKNTNIFDIEKHKKTIEFIKLYNKFVLNLPKVNYSSNYNTKNHTEVLDALAEFIKHFYSYLINLEYFHSRNILEECVKEAQCFQGSNIALKETLAGVYMTPNQENSKIAEYEKEKIFQLNEAKEIAKKDNESRLHAFKILKNTLLEHFHHINNFIQFRSYIDSQNFYKIKKAIEVFITDFNSFQVQFEEILNEINLIKINYMINPLSCNSVSIYSKFDEIPKDACFFSWNISTCSFQNQVQPYLNANLTSISKTSNVSHAPEYITLHDSFRRELKQLSDRINLYSLIPIKNQIVSEEQQKQELYNALKVNNDIYNCLKSYIFMINYIFTDEKIQEWIKNDTVFIAFYDIYNFFSDLGYIQSQELKKFRFQKIDDLNKLFHHLKSYSYLILDFSDNLKCIFERLVAISMCFDYYTRLRLGLLTNQLDVLCKNLEEYLISFRIYLTCSIKNFEINTSAYEMRIFLQNLNPLSDV
ncbi:hypothetical protein EDEG_02319 [Edhazardia aedis USNM 41457]|uniref:Uncharacterized protein n=1 Tax=Edhazardia aedis (strain USNM 41457) TaxID=1003232 RepID=J9DPQ8_EDHAE|nr:hypothetical protein EDEG_02319 [Edhazardia aedis USNM 41457]|eukprot:EJW03342.1 hypothetical protein EDEG_02319 [Edhazardia aedis USNM 41457]